MEEKDWKQRYLDQLDELERQERIWQNRQHVLQRLLVRASLAAEGQDPGLDALLGELRDQVREDMPDLSRLQQLQEQLDNRVLDWDRSRSRNLQQLQEALQGMIAAQLRLAQSSDRRVLRRLDRGLRKGDLGMQDLPQLLRELSRVQEEVSRRAPRPGLLQRLFGGASAEGETPSGAEETKDPAEGEAGAESGQWLPGSGESLDLDSEAGQQTEITLFSNRIRELLAQLMEQVVLQGSARTRAEQLQMRLAESSRWDHLREAVDEIAQLVLVAVGRGRREFETFLANLDERLARIQHFMREGLSDPEVWQGASARFEEDMRSELDQLGSLAGSATDLASLKNSVRHHVDTLTEALGRFREQENQREAHFRAQIEALQGKLEALEAQSAGMQRQLVRERERAITDALTRLPNREALENQMQQEFARWERYRHHASLLILDIDHFKTINDEYGHLAGDKVIRLIATALREQLRSADFIARYGGEEFVVLMPETPLEQALQVANKLREHVASLPFHFRGERLRVTLSGGIVPFGAADDPSSLFELADRALYDAKSAGRNRIISSGEAENKT